MRAHKTSQPIELLGISGTVGPGRRTNALVQAVLDAAQRMAPEVDARLLDAQAAGLPLCDGRPPERYEGTAAAAIERVLRADGCVIATPVYRASFSAVLKNLLDLLPGDALAGTPVVLAVTGGSRDHALVADYALRPVLGTMRALVLPDALYADPAAMPDGVPGAELAAHAEEAAAALVRAVRDRRPQEDDRVR